MSGPGRVVRRRAVWTVLVGLTACGAGPARTAPTTGADAPTTSTTYPAAIAPEAVPVPPTPAPVPLPPRPEQPDPTQPPYEPPVYVPPPPEEVCTDVGGAHLCIDDRSAEVGRPVVLTVTGTTGECPVMVTWVEGTEPGCATTHTYDSPGTYEIRVVVGSITNAFTVEVSPPRPPA